MSFRRFRLVVHPLGPTCRLVFAIGGIVLAVRGSAQSTRAVSPPEVQTVSAMGGASRPFQIEYTGALFGYYRMEFADDRRLPAVQAFLKGRTKDSPLLLGMGDNFAPEFGAALQLESKGNFCERLRAVYLGADPYARNDPPTAFYKDDKRIAKEAFCDNVASFLMSAGYRAVVPGREDFLYSASWLQGMAQLLRDASASGYVEEIRNIGGPQTVPSNPDGKLHLLAANLRLGKGEQKTTEKGPAAKKTKTTTEEPEDKSEQARKQLTPCPLLFSDAEEKQGAGKAPSTLCVASEGEDIPQAQDWLERLDVTLDPENDVAAGISERARTDAYVRRQVLLNAVDILQAALPYSNAGREFMRVDGVHDALRALSRTEEYKIDGTKLAVKQAGNVSSPVRVIAGARGKVCPGTESDTSRDEKAKRSDLCTLLDGVASAAASSCRGAAYAWAIRITRTRLLTTA